MSFSDSPDNNYSSILNEIEQEEEKYKELKKELETCKNHLRANEILNNPEFTREKLFQVRVKVFRTFTDLLAVLPEKVTAEELSSQTLNALSDDCNIFLIELFVSRPFHNKLLAKEWLVDFSIAAGGRKIAKSVTLRNRAANPITAVLAVPQRRTNDEIVEVFLTSPTNWRRIQLAKIPSDVSFKFTNCKSKAGVSVDQAIEKINRIYAEHEDKQQPSTTNELLSYKLRCELDRESFIAATARNSYASLDPAQIISNEGNRAAKIEIIDQRVQLELDVGKKCLRIEAPGEELCQLKRYFTMASLNDGRKWQKQDFQHIQSVNILKVHIFSFFFHLKNLT